MNPQPISPEEKIPSSGPFSKKIIIVGIIIFILILVSVPITVLLLGKKQEDQSHAQAATNLYFTPSTLITTTGKQFTVDLYINPGNNEVTLANIHFQYDASLLTLEKIDPAPKINVTANNPSTNSFSISQGGPPETIVTTTKLATLTFSALTATTSATIDIDRQGTTILSLAPQDQAQENVLEGTNPALVSIAENDTPISTQSGTTNIILSVKLPAIGGGIGDNPTPLHTTRQAVLSLIDVANKVTSINGSVTYVGTPSGVFTGTFKIPSTVKNGTYEAKIKLPNTLRKNFPSLLTIQQEQTITIPNPIALISGDISNTNTIDVSDYSKVSQSCFYTDADIQAHKSKCSAFEAVDLNDDGVVDSIDLNIFQRGMSTLNGD